MLDIPMPEDDDMSDDDFDGYLSDDSDIGQDDTPDNSSGEAASDSTGSEQPIPQFEQPFGCAKDMEGASPLKFFEQMVSTKMMDDIVEQTNLYARQYMESTNLPPHSRAHGWSRTPFDRNEFKKFLAMTITMGIVNYPEMEDYWSTIWPYATPAFSKVSRLSPSLSTHTYTHNVMHTHTHTHTLTHTEYTSLGK